MGFTDYKCHTVKVLISKWCEYKIFKKNYHKWKYYCDFSEKIKADIDRDGIDYILHLPCHKKMDIYPMIAKRRKYENSIHVYVTTRIKLFLGVK